MKKLFAKLFILVFLSLTFFVPASFAKGPQQPVNVVLEKNEIINKDYFAAGDTVTLSGTVNGDAYIAGGNVLMEGTINGDLFVAGGMVTIRGRIKNDLRAAGGNVTIAGPVGGNVTVGGGNTTVSPEGSIVGSLLAGSGNLELHGPVGKGLTAGVGNLTINAPVGGDALLGTGQLTLQPKTRIAGDLTYWSEQEAVLQGTATVTGELTYHNLPRQDAKAATFAKGRIGIFTGLFAGTAAMMAGILLVALFVFGLVLMTLLPNFTGKVMSIIEKNPWGSFGLGVVTVILLPVLAVTAMVTIIGIPVGIFLFMALGVLCLVGHIYAAVFIGRGVFTWLKTDTHRAWQLLVGLVILGIFMLIPIVGWLARAIFILIGTGAVLFEKHAVYRQMRMRHLV